VSDMPDTAGTTTPMTPPPEAPGPFTRLFIGRDGLRALWSMIVFAMVLLATAFVILGVAGLVFAALVHNRGGMSSLVGGTTSGAGITTTTPLTIVISSWPLAVAVLVSTFVMARIEHRSPWSYGLGLRRAGGLFAAGLGWGFLALSALVGLLALTGHLTISTPANPPLVALRYAAEWAIAFLGVGLFEETIARGYLQTRLSRAFGFWPAAVILSIAFGAGHFSNRGETTIGLIGAGTVGLVLCYSLYRSGSLWWAIGFHAGWDWTQSYFYGTHDSGIASRGALLTSDPIGATWLSGGTTGPEGSVLIFVILIAVALVIRWTLTPPTTDSRP
jgi:membrane protease YdiL (CAAX protease family)